MAPNGNHRNEGIILMAMGVILFSALFIIGVDGVSAALGYACTVVVFILGAVMVGGGRRRSGRG